MVNSSSFSFSMSHFQKITDEVHKLLPAVGVKQMQQRHQLAASIKPSTKRIKFSTNQCKLEYKFGQNEKIQNIKEKKGKEHTEAQSGTILFFLP